ncbi:MAG: GNAT family N-acetyltransferase [Saprospiraceae bacterium]|nr:GNAT family N-acetyltransferase [Saprospiraceae bacterium]
MLRPFWQDAVCGEKAWDVCVATDQGGEVTGFLVYHFTHYHGLPIIKMPPLTDYSGLWLHYPENQEKNSSRYTFEKEVCKTLIAQLPKTAFFYQQWHPSITNWLPFYWQGFRQTSLYTYQLDLQDKTNLQKNLSQTIRKNLRKLEQVVAIEVTHDVEQLYHLLELSFARRQATFPYSLASLQKIDNALNNRNLRRIYLAKDSSNHYIAGLYLVWDERCAYSLFTGSDPNQRQNRASYLLQWQSILDSMGNVNTYDFCGSILEPVEESLRSFGGVLTPHFKINRTKNKLFYLAGVLLNKEV